MVQNDSLKSIDNRFHRYANFRDSARRTQTFLQLFIVSERQPTETHLVMLNNVFESFQLFYCKT